MIRKPSPAGGSITPCLASGGSVLAMAAVSYADCESADGVMAISATVLMIVYKRAVGISIDAL